MAAHAASPKAQSAQNFKHDHGEWPVINCQMEFHRKGPIKIAGKTEFRLPNRLRMKQQQNKQKKQNKKAMMQLVALPACLLPLPLLYSCYVGAFIHISNH